MSEENMNTENGESVSTEKEQRQDGSGQDAAAAGEPAQEGEASNSTEDVLKEDKREKEDKENKEDKTEKDGKYKKENRILSEKNKELEKSLEELQDKYLRLAAEYDNFRKRSAKEKEGIYADACADCILNILPITDNLERALSFPDSDKVVDGVRMTMSSFEQALKKLGVEEIETKVFDPALHNAVMHVGDVNSGERGRDEVFQKGYKRGDKVIRHAMVKVAN